MVVVNDQVASSSGQVHLGIDGGPNTDAFDIGSLSPFGHIHMISGVIHDPILGQSGIIRFQYATPGFYVSLDGGVSFSQLLDVNSVFSTISGLNAQYQVGNYIETLEAFGNVELIANETKTRFSSLGNIPHINISGLITVPSTAQSVTQPDITPALGDLYMMTHGVGDGAAHGATTAAQVKAKSLGIGTLFLNTGSGVANICVGSGIRGHENDSQQTVTNTPEIVVSFDNEILFDANYTYNSSTDVFTILSPGLYRIYHKINYDITSGTSRSIARSRIVHNGTGIPRSRAYAYCRLNSAGESTGSSTIYLNCDAGDTIDVRAVKIVGGSTVVTIANESVIYIEKIGPKRG